MKKDYKHFLLLLPFRPALNHQRIIVHTFKEHRACGEGERDKGGGKCGSMGTACIAVKEIERKPVIRLKKKTKSTIHRQLGRCCVGGGGGGPL